MCEFPDSVLIPGVDGYLQAITHARIIMTSHQGNVLVVFSARMQGFIDSGPSWCSAGNGDASTDSGKVLAL